MDNRETLIDGWIGIVVHKYIYSNKKESVLGTDGLRDESNCAGKRKLLPAGKFTVIVHRNRNRNRNRNRHGQRHGQRHGHGHGNVHRRQNISSGDLLATRSIAAFSPMYQRVW